MNAPGDSHVGFPQTSWTLVRALQQASAAERQTVWNEWLQRYWKPVYAYFRSRQQTPDQAADLTQGFLQHILAENKLQSVQLGTSFRHWLRQCARNYMIQTMRYENAQKRHPAQGGLSLEELRLADAQPYEPAVGEDPDRAFTEAWRREILAKAIAAVRRQCEVRDRLVDFRIFEAYYVLPEAGPGKAARPTWAQLAEQFGLTSWKESARKADCVKNRLAVAIRAEIRRYVDTDDDAEDELRELLE